MRTKAKTKLPPLERARDYIKRTWKTLTRTPWALAQAAADEKIEGGGKALVYVSAKEDLGGVRRLLSKTMDSKDLARLEVRALPKSAGPSLAPGLLYLPRPYVVPGGRFNEMYGWDSYFILLGLLRDGITGLAQDMADNQLYQVEHYGRVLNANRTYFLTRSQPPFLSAMVLAVYAKTRDRRWLERAKPALENYYAHWTRGRRAVDTGLSRYFDDGEGPAPEVLSSERDAQGRSQYDRVKDNLKTFDEPGFERARLYDAATDSLTPFFYKNDRAMRESGFDPSDRFGPCNAETVDINPVCLNALLHRMENDMAEVSAELGDLEESGRWLSRARDRKLRMNALMWDEKDGLFYDYDHHRRARRVYPFVSTYYALWSGIADARQAARLRENLPLFERAGGLSTSPRKTGKQWDAPFGWAPMQLIAAEGLRRYGYDSDADRISTSFLSLVLKDFIAHGSMVEKYDVERLGSDVSADIAFGYSSNEVGFGWTNAVFQELFAKLPESARRDLRGTPARAARVVRANRAKTPARR